MIPPATAPLACIVSGGQTGADRAALDTALVWGIPTGGWVPRGRRAEDGVIPLHYAGLMETTSASYSVRTRRNVRDSDGTLLLSHGPLEGGSISTLAFAERLQRPVLHLDLARSPFAAAVLDATDWIRDAAIARLNVAGPRASRDPHIHLATVALLSGVLGRLAARAP